MHRRYGGESQRDARGISNRLLNYAGGVLTEQTLPQINFHYRRTSGYRIRPYDAGGSLNLQDTLPKVCDLDGTPILLCLKRMAL